MGVALLVCSLWAYLQAQALAGGPVSEPRLHWARLRLTVLVRALTALLIDRLGGLALEWPTHKTIPQGLRDAASP